MNIPRLRLNQLSTGVRQRLSNAIARGRNALEQPLPQHTQAVDFSRLNATQFRRIVNDWPIYHQLATEGSETIPHFQDLLADLYFALYLYNPATRDRTELQPDHRLNWDLLNQAQMLPLWDQQRARSAMRENHSRIGLTILARSLLDAVTPAETEKAQQSREQQAQQQDASEELEQMLGALDEMLEDQRQESDAPAAEAGDGADPDSEPGADDDAANSMSEQIETLAASTEMNPDESRADPDRARRAARHGLKDMLDQIAQLDDVLAKWGVDAGEFDAMPAQDAMDAFQRLRDLPNLKQFAEELGRHREEMKQARRQVNSPEPEEVMDIVPGRTIGGMVPSEWLLFSDPDLESLFWIRYMQNALMTWQYAGRQQASRGPFILCIDVSGSTEGPRQIWGKAFTLAAIEMARAEHRDTGVIFFDGEVRPDGIFVFPGGRATLMDKLRLAEYWTGGGTNFEQPLSIALANIETATGEWQGADIVLVTDGEYDLSDAFATDYRRRCQALGIRTHGVVLDGNDRYARKLETVCDRAIQVRSLAGAEAIKPIFDNIG